MIVAFENYGKFYFSLNYVNDMEATYDDENYTLKECMEFIEGRMTDDLTILSAYVCDAETGEIVAIVSRENDDFLDDDEDYYEPDYDECGFNPYMGCYDFDC